MLDLTPHPFEWDEKKNRINRSKHGVWFEEAKQAFNDPRGLISWDVSHSDANEERYILLGMSASLRILVVVFCEQKSKPLIRIISARTATKKEREVYEKGI